MTLLAKPVVASDICVPLEKPTVLATVHFNDKPSFRTKEVDDIRTERRLTPKAKAIETPIAQLLPKLELRGRQTLPHDFAQAAV